MSTQSKNSSKGRSQFGLRTLLWLTLLVAVAIVGWQKFFYVHPAHENRSYEKAPYVRSGSARLGDGSLSIVSVSRNDRNGNLLVEDGSGSPLKTAPRNAKILADAGPWLDAAQIELQSEGIETDIKLIRIFDFETRQLITEFNKSSGQRLVDPNTIQFYRLGEKLPDRVDVFMRLNVYDPKDPVAILSPTVGATCNALGGTFEVRELVRGFSSYTSETGIVASPEAAKSEMALMLGFNGTWPKNEKYQIVAVRNDDTRVHHNRFLSTPGGYLDMAGRPAQLIVLMAGLDDIKHFELRRYGGGNRFFFEGVKLPKTSTAKFAVPPSPVVAIDINKPVAVDELAPLKVTIEALPGDAVNGTISNEQFRHVNLKQDIQNTDKSTTIVGQLSGLSVPRWKIIVNAEAGPVDGNKSGSTSGGGSHLAYELVDVPHEEIMSVKIIMPSP